MTDGGEDIAAGRAPGTATAEALAMAGAGRDKANAYLSEQIDLARLQKQNLLDQNAFELSHLRWRRLNDQLAGAFRIILVVLALAVLAGVAALLWNASEADGLIVDSFSAPADFAARGMGGDVLANDLTNRIAEVRKITIAHSISMSSDVSKNGDDIRVDIPDTGISLSEAWRLLRRWLGHEQHLTGSLRELPDGKIALHVAFADGTRLDVTGAAGDLDKLEQNLAEQVFTHFDPSNVVLYLWATGRPQEALKQAERDALSVTGRERQADSYSLWSNVTRNVVGDIPLSIERIRISLALDPKIAAAHNEYAAEAHLLGHSELELAERRAAMEQTENDQPKTLQGAGYILIHNLAIHRVAELLGDFGAAEAAECGVTCLPNNLSAGALYAARRHDVATARTLLVSARASGQADPDESVDAAYYIAMSEGDGAAAAGAARAHMPGQSGGAAYAALVDRVETKPMLAMALALAGDTASARTIADATPADCYPCQIARASAAVAAKDWRRADFWFAHAVALAPSIPFADTDWGAMLIAKGDLDGAISKFTIANQKGPHFADPLEMWGEVLIAKNRSDLALAKFEEANKYAPDWARLHLKWGEALLWSGDKSGAQKQFDIASHLDLTAPEKSELVRVSHG
jgi:tetratricopeptide (TPR) repeat protein